MTVLGVVERRRSTSVPRKRRRCEVESVSFDVEFGVGNDGDRNGSRTIRDK